MWCVPNDLLGMQGEFGAHVGRDTSGNAEWRKEGGKRGGGGGGINHYC